MKRTKFKMKRTIKAKKKFVRTRTPAGQRIKPRRTKLSNAQYLELECAKRLLALPEITCNVLAGMTREKARYVIAKYSI